MVFIKTRSIEIELKNKKRVFMMNGFQRINAALNGERADVTPVMLHNLLMAVEESPYNHAQYRQDPKKIAETYIQSVEKYKFDGVVVDVDTVTLSGAVGVPVDFPENEPARSHEAYLEELEEVDDLEPIDISKNDRVQIWVEATRLIKAHFGDEIYVRGNCDQCAFSLASSMRSPVMWMMDLMDEDQQERVHKLLDFTCDVTTQFIRLMAATGCDMVSNGDSPAGPDMISPEMYRDFALASEQRVAAAAHAAGVKYLLHICGNTTVILEDMVNCGADAIELDYKTDINKIYELCHDKLTFVGNVDPVSVLAQGSLALVEAKTLELLNLYKDSPRFILNAGCAIPPSTPPENLQRFVALARNFSY